MNYSPGILHAFDPKLLYHHHHHDEVRFVYGRYLDIATQKGKDRRSLYFGTSKNSDLLAGIFLGDLELTSRVKDVSMVSNGKDVTITVKYVNDQGKLTTLKGKVPTSAYVDTISGLGDEILQKIKVIDSSVKIITNRLNKIDSSINALTDTVNDTVTSLNDLIGDLDNGKYNYTVKYSEGIYNEGQPRLYTLNKGENTADDSSVISIYDYVLKELKYNDEDNALIARTWPNNIDELEKTWTDEHGNQVTARLKPEYIQEVKVNLDELQEHITNYITYDSSLGERLNIIETALAWEDLFTDGD
jgi:hypothetical protein